MPRDRLGHRGGGVYRTPLVTFEFVVRFLPEDRVYRSAGPVDLYLAAAGAGILVEQPCGAQGTCGRCRVKVHSGDVPPGEADREQLTALELAAGWRLGCQMTLAGDTVVEVPALTRSLAGKSFGPDFIPGLPGERVVDVPGFGLAVDIGTTSLACALICLDDGRVAASASSLNPQVALGADVIARIKHASEHEDGLARLSRLVREGLASLVRELMEGAGCGPGDVVTAAVAGNPTMLQAWAGVPITRLGAAPYEAAWSAEQNWGAADVELPIDAGARVYVFPMIRSHVGGDAVAAAVATAFDRGQAPRLLVDLGTNCEVLVASGDRVVSTSAAAGPAFEGVSIRCGMRAAPGAVDVVSFEPLGEVRLHTIADRPATGLCGSALMDLAAEMLRVGLLAPSGYLRKPHELAAGAAPFGARLREVEGQAAFLVSAEHEGAARDVVLTARDIRELQLAKGSTLAAITLACRELGLDPGDLEEVLVAGAFGNFLRTASLVRIHLVPQVDPERIRFVGNAAGVGARLAVLDRGVRARASAFAARARYLELATHPDYQDAFMRSLSF